MPDGENSGVTGLNGFTAGWGPAQEVRSNSVTPITGNHCTGAAQQAWMSRWGGLNSGARTRGYLTESAGRVMLLVRLPV